MIFAEDLALQYFLRLIGINAQVPVKGNYADTILYAISYVNSSKVRVLVFVDTNPENLKNFLKNKQKEGLIRIDHYIPIRCCEHSIIEIYHCITKLNYEVYIINLVGEHKENEKTRYSIEGFVGNCIDNLVYCYKRKGNIQESLAMHIGFKYLNYILPKRLKNNSCTKQLIDILRQKGFL